MNAYLKLLVTTGLFITFITTNVYADCYQTVLKEDAPQPEVLNIILIDETTPILKNVQDGYEYVVDKVARRYGNRNIVVPFSSLTAQQPPVATIDVHNEPPISDEVLQSTAIKVGKTMQTCVLSNAQKNAITVKKQVHQELHKNSNFDAYSEILFALRSMLVAYAPPETTPRVRLIIYSDGYINSLKGFSLYSKGKPRIPDPEKDLKKINKFEHIIPVSKPFEVIWFGLGAKPASLDKGYLAPSDLEKLKDFWTSILQKMGANKIQMDLLVSNPDLD